VGAFSFCLSPAGGLIFEDTFPHEVAVDTEEAQRVAHEVNNALAIIGTLSELLLQGRAPGDPERSDIEAIRAAAERAAEAVRRLEGRLADPVSEATGDRPSFSRPTPAGTLLLVESDAAFRGTIRRLLAAEGFTVLDAASWDEASGLVVGAGLSVDAILSRSPGPKDAAGPDRAIPRVLLPHDLGTSPGDPDARARLLSSLGPLLRARQESLS
jgi:hypothetical protein